MWTLISCPPNYLWQSWLEKTYPGYTSPDEPGTATSIAQLPAVKSATDTAAPALQAINEKTAPTLQVLSEKTGALEKGDEAVTRQIGEGNDIMSILRECSELLTER